MSEIIRGVFYEKIGDKLYVFLRQGFLKEWEPRFVFKLTKKIIDEKKSEIDTYLQNHMVKLENINDHINYVVMKILIPYVRNLRVK